MANLLPQRNLSVDLALKAPTAALNTARAHGYHEAGMGLLTLMSFVKHREHDWNVLHAHQREVD